MNILLGKSRGALLPFQPKNAKAEADRFTGKPKHSFIARSAGFIKRHHQEPSAASVAASQRASATTSTLVAFA